MKKIVLLAILVNLLFAGSDEERVKDLFIQKADKVIEIVKNKKIEKDKRNQMIVETITPMFDFELMARLSLGKNVWRSLDDGKQKEFTKLYVDRMKQSYSSKVDSYTDEKIVINGVKRTKKNRMELLTSLLDEEKATEVIYKLHKPKRTIENKEDWLVYDVEIIGVSIIKTDRAQFYEVLKSNTIEELMEKLRG